MTRPFAWLAAPDTNPSYDEMWMTAVSAQDARIIEATGVRRIESATARSTYYFTTVAHPAHPSAVRRQIIQREDGYYYLQTRAFCYDDRAKPAFERWMQILLGRDRAQTAGDQASGGEEALDPAASAHVPEPGS